MSESPGEFGFRLLRRGDLPLLTRWLAEEHVARWWDEPGDPECEYLDSGEPVSVFLALFDGRPVGMVQLYRWEDFAGEAAAVGAQPGEAGIDYLIGERGLIGRGLGPEMLRAFLRAHVWPEPDISGVRVDVAPANRRSWRCLEKLGFRRAGLVAPGPGSPARGGPHYVYVAQRQSAQGERASACS